MTHSAPQAANRPPDGQVEDVLSAADGNAVVSRTVKAPAEFVWAVLADGWMYATWVVGASRIREVDPGWPERGSRLHHSVGLWPTLLDDTTEVLEMRTGQLGGELVLQARAWPAGAAHVRIRVAAARAKHSTVSIVEDVTDGPGRLVPRAARQLLIVPRNKETLQRLALIAEGRYRESVESDALSRAASAGGSTRSG